MVQRRRPHRRRLLYQNKAANATLTLTLDRPLGDRGAFLTAAGASLGNGTLVVTGSVTGTGQASDLIQDLITTSGYITGDFADKIINVTSHEQLVFKAYQTYKAGVTHYVLGASLAWFSGTPTSHGNFTLGAGETFDVDVNLTQQIANPAKNWDGRSLTVTASNSSTLILSAGNNLATGTLAVRGGDLVITGSTGVGSGLIGGSADFTTVAPVVTVRDGGYWGVNGALVIGDVSAGGVWYNGGAGLVITGGTVVSASGLFSGAGPVSASVGAGGLWRTTGDLILGTGTSRLSIAGSVSVGGMYRQDYGVNTLTLTLDGPRGAFLTAGSIILGSSGTLRIDGATAVDGGAANFASSGSASALGSGANAQVLLQATAGTISGDFAAVTVSGNAGSTGSGRDFILVGGVFINADRTQYLYGTGLAWEVTAGGAAHGNFTLAYPGEQFIFDRNLSARSGTFSTGWDGQTMTLTGSNRGSFVNTATLTLGGLRILNGTLINRNRLIGDLYVDSTGGDGAVFRQQDNAARASATNAVIGDSGSGALLVSAGTVEVAQTLAFGAGASGLGRGTVSGGLLTVGLVSGDKHLTVGGSDRGHLVVSAATVRS